MAFAGKVYWIDASNQDVIGWWDSATGTVDWVTGYMVPDMPTTGGPFEDNLGEFGPLEPLGDGRIVSALGSVFAETALVFDSDLDPSDPDYWLDAPLGGGDGSDPDVLNAVFDPDRNAVWVPRLRNKDLGTGSVDTWTAYDVADGSVLSSEARTNGAWDFSEANDSFTSEVYGRCTLIGDMLYRTDSDGFADRYQIGGGTWDVTSIFATGRSFNAAIVGGRNDGTPLFFTESRPPGLFTGPVEYHLATYDPAWTPISSSFATIGAAAQIGDLTPTASWRVDTDPDYNYQLGGANPAPVKVIDDVAYYFRIRSSDSVQQFIAHDLTTDVADVVFSVGETWLHQDGTVTTDIDDPDLWFVLRNAGWGLAVLPGSGPQEAPPGRRSPRPYGRRYPPQEARQRSGRRAGGYY